MSRLASTLLTLLLLAQAVLAQSPQPQQPPEPQPAQSQPGPSPDEQYLLQKANEHRAEQNLPPLRWDPSLARAAHDHVVLILQTAGAAQHQYPGEPDLKARTVLAGARFSTISENVAGNAGSAKEIERSWMNSDVHRANILDPRLDTVGIAVVQRHGTYSAVQDFARSVAALKPEEIEQQALELLGKRGIKPAASPEATEDARKTCQQPNTTNGKPILVMQWDGADLSRLPTDLLKQVPEAPSHTVAVGSCPSERQGEGFTTYHLAVLLY
ncbi:MAG TPA: CAP domain-containing protein [Edaphobacter sp.]|nr:CAP domain-containing protein [Edaphobacter sp.]